MSSSILKRALVLLLATLPVLSVVATGKAEPAKTAVTLKYVGQYPTQIDPKNNPILAEAAKLSGITLDVEAPPLNDYGNRLRIIMASGDLPDFFLGGTDVDFENWSKQGLLATLNDKLSKEKYPNLMKNVTPERWGDTTAASTGKIQGVPRVNNVDYWGYMVNNEWLAKLNLRAPTTLDEFRAVAKAFTFNDPDGNGKNDTFGYTTQDDIWFLHTDFLKTVWNLSVHNGVPDLDGKYRAKGNSLGYLDYLTFLRDMYTEGTLDPEFFINTGSIDQEKFVAGKIGIIGASQKNTLDFIQKYNAPADKYSFHAPLASKAGVKARFIVPPSDWMAFLIPAGSKKVDDVLRFLDFANSEQGFELFQIGIKGVHYTSYDVTTRTIDRTPAQASLLAKYADAMCSFANGYLDRAAIEGGPSEVTRQKFQTEWATAQKSADFLPVPFVKIYDAFFSSVPDLVEKARQMEIRYINGGVTKDQFVSFLTTEYQPKTAQFDKQYNDYMLSLKK
jgi:ABC-type glycerol-3-phosphate transport system substrate-binding protein